MGPVQNVFPHSTDFNYEFRQLMEGRWEFSEDNIPEATAESLRCLVGTFVNRVGFKLEALGLHPRQYPVPPFSDLSFALVINNDVLYFLLGTSPMRTSRYSILRDLRGTGIPLTANDVMEEFQNHRRWTSCVISSVPAGMLSMPSSQQWEFMDGYAKQMAADIEALNQPQNAIDPELCFVIMSFSKDTRLREIYKKAIQPTVKRLGFRCERVDEQQFNTSIIQRVRDNIARAGFVIADMSEERPNCYYELGIAHEKGKEVIHLAASTQDIHFDVHDLNFIIYDGIDDLKAKLRERIRGTVGDRRRRAQQLAASANESTSPTRLAQDEVQSPRIGLNDLAQLNESMRQPPIFGDIRKKQF